MKEILLVEDDPKDAELTLIALNDLHLKNDITHVSNGVKALDYLLCQNEFSRRKQENPVLVLLDLKMPKMGGIEFLKCARSYEKFKHVPIVVFTSSNEDRDLEACYKLGVNAYVVKPLDFEQFVDIMKTLGLFWVIVNEPLKE